MKKIVQMILFSIETILIFIIIGAFSTAITKNIYTEVMIQNFISKGILNEEKSTTLLKVYEIESDIDRPTVTYDGRIMPGNSGDIIISLTSEIEIPIVKETISFFAGGHAALVLDDYEDKDLYASPRMIVETTGIDRVLGNLAIVSGKDYWVRYSLYKQVIGLRVDTTKEQRNKVISKAISLVGDEYNYSFIADTKNKTYCSDLVSKVYSAIGINLNKDSFTTSVYDLVVSNNTYISYYHYFDENYVRYVYYLV